MIGFVVDIPGLGYFKEWRVAAGEMLQTTQDVTRARHFRHEVEADVVVASLRNLLQRSGIRTVVIVLPKL